MRFLIHVYNMHQHICREEDLWRERARSDPGLMLLDHHKSHGQESGRADIFRSLFLIPTGFFLLQNACPETPSPAAPWKSHCRCFEHGIDCNVLRGEE